MTRISTHAFYARSTDNLADLRAQAERLQTQIGTNERLQAASDDPAAARQLRTLAREAELARVHQGNADLAVADLTLADQAIAELVNLTQRAVELATQSASGTMNDDQRRINGNQLAEIHSNMQAILAGKNSVGEPLFGDGITTWDMPIGAGIDVRRGLSAAQITQFQQDGDTINLLDIVRDLARSLTDGDPSATNDAQSALSSLSAGLTNLTTGQAAIGATQNRVASVLSLATDRAEIRAEQQQQLGATDMTTAIAELQQVMLVLEASQASFSQLSGLSLFSYLR